MTHHFGQKPGSGKKASKTVGRGILTGLAALGTAMADGPKLQRIDVIDQEIKDLRQERDHLIAGLIEPGDLKPSKHYDPNAYVGRSVSSPAPYSSDLPPGSPLRARLEHCKGREYSGKYHKAHPACPYIDTIHNAHDFTLRD
jgi:hypothetical protein